MSSPIPKLSVDMHCPQTPEMERSRWATPHTGLEEPPQYTASPSSPESPLLPSSPTNNQWGSLDHQIRVAENDSPKSMLRGKAALSRQPSIKRKPISINGLTIGSQVGTGSFSRTFQAYGPQGVFAVKTRLSSTEPELFVNERQILTKLMKATGGHNHVPIVQFYPELSETDQLVFKLYETSLEALVLSPKFQPGPEDFDFFDFRNQSQPLVGLKRWIDWARQLVSGMEFIHSQNIIHADFKPDNVLVSNDQLVIADFSGAINLSLPPSSQMDKHLQLGLAWSPVYTDPELRSGRCLPSAGTDIYSMGLVLAFCATGQQPYSSAKNATQRLMWMDKVEPLQSFDMDVQPRLTHVKPVIQKCLMHTCDGIDAHLSAIAVDK